MGHKLGACRRDPRAAPGCFVLAMLSLEHRPISFESSLLVVGVQSFSPQSRGGSRRSDAERYPAYRAFTGVVVFRESRNFRELSFEMNHRPKSVATAKNTPPAKAAMM
jgi:hypothetical protein